MEKIETNDKIELILKLDHLEEFYIKKLKTMYYEEGFNLKCGGNSAKLSRESKLKISQALKGNKIWLGKHHSIEAKSKISKSLTGKTQSDFTKLKRALGQIGNKNPFYGKHHSEETKLKISQIISKKQLGENNQFYGKHHSNISKEKMSKTKKENFKLKLKQKESLIMQIYFKIMNNEKGCNIIKEMNISKGFFSNIKHKYGAYGEIIDEYLERNEMQ